MQPYHLRNYLAITALEGLLTTGWLILTRSNSKAAAWIGFSRMQLILLGICAITTLVLGVLSLSAWLFTEKFHRLCRRLDGNFLQDNLLIPASLTFLFGAITLTASTIVFLYLNNDQLAKVSTWAGQMVYSLSTRIKQASPLLTWASLALLEAVILVLGVYRGEFREKQRWQMRTIGATVFFWIITVVVLLQWGILVFHLDALHNIPGYYWEIKAKPVTIRTLVFPALLIAVVAVTWMVSMHPRRVWFNLLLICTVSYAIQLGIGMADGQGVESLRQRYFGTYHRAYAYFASYRDDSIVDTIRNYEQLYSQAMFPSTKPPGVMTLNVAIERALNLFHPQADAQARYAQLMDFIAWAFPPLSVAAIVLIFCTMRKVTGPGDNPMGGYLAGIFFALAPNIALLSLFLDQAIYPALFLTGIFSVVMMVRKKSPLLSFITGCFIYLAAFMTFSMLPLIGLAILYAGFELWQRQNESEPCAWLKMAAQLVLMVCGIAALYLIFKYTLNYDFFTRYSVASSKTFDINYFQRGDIPDVGSYSNPLLYRVSLTLSAAYLNNVELAVSVGIPFFVLFILRGTKALWAVIRRIATPGEAAQAAIFSTYLSLNVYALNRGEVARLWMFWVPPIMILAVIEILPWTKGKPWLFYGLLAVQAITLALTYQFQDLLV